MPEVYIIILNYKNWRDVVECLESIFHATYNNFKVVVIDNHSQNDSLLQLTNWAAAHPILNHADNGFKYISLDRDYLDANFHSIQFPRLTFVQNNENTGFASGNNVMLKHLKDTDAYIWMLNPDMTIDKNAITELVNFAANHTKHSIIGSTVKYHSHPDKIHFYAGGIINFNSATTTLAEKISDIPKLDYVSGGALFTHASNFKTIGLLPEHYFLYWEETDWCYHSKKLGYQILACTSAICYDKISTSIGKSYLADFYYVRNGLIFLLKYNEKKIPIAVFFGFIRMMKRFLAGKFKRARGVFDGIVSFLKMDHDENK